MGVLVFGACARCGCFGVAHVQLSFLVHKALTCPGRPGCSDRGPSKAASRGSPVSISPFRRPLTGSQIETSGLGHGLKQDAELKEACHGSVPW